MHVIDETTMQEILRFVKAHHTFVRHNRVIRQRVLEMGVLLQDLKDLAEKYSGVFEKAQASEKKTTRKKA